MPEINPCQLPEKALLNRYDRAGYYHDCFVTEAAGRISLEQYVLAFYTTALFRLERFILKWAVSRPSTDAQVAALAQGKVKAFAAWQVEDRREDQLLLSDFRGRTRSWLMVSASHDAQSAYTRLYFGSAIVPDQTEASGRPRIGPMYRALLGFHKTYSVALLGSARQKLLS